ncbi:glycine cleavage system protein GcvH [bacterium]|nr:glycine cleavage system protein GcvH [bacterium]
MSEIRENLRYTTDHEWAEKLSQPKKVKVGITDFAQNSLGDVTFVELPEAGKSVKKGEVIGSVESVKAVSDIFAPLTGKILSVNEALNDDPSPLNTAPFEGGWLIEMEIENEEEWNQLLSAQAYEQHAQ